MAYYDKVSPKEDLCAAYMEQAREVREQNNDLPSKEEFYYLTEAAKIRQELAKISIGEARELQLRHLRDLKARREDIAKYLDPEGYRRLVEKSRLAGEASQNSRASGSSSAKGNSNSTGSKTIGSEAISDETVKSWFKDKPKHGFNDVAGMKDLKQRLANCALGTQWNRIKGFLNMPTVHTYFFYGLPGCGKTFIANAFAHELMEKDFSYMSLSGGQIMSSKVGIAEKTIERVFDEAKKHAPCILFIDEIDGVCADRNDENTPQYARSLTTSFLTGYNSLKDFEKKIIFIAATNYPALVDPAMLDRAELIYVDIPDKEARQHALELKFEKICDLEDGFTYSEMADRTQSYNYRDLDRLEEHMKDKIFAELRTRYQDEQAAYSALVNREYKISRSLFESAFAAYEPTPKDREKEAMQNWRDKVARD